MTTMEILARAKAACAGAADLDARKINAALEKMADRLIAHTPGILAANEADMAAAKEKLSPVMLDRLLLTKARIEAMADGIRAVAALKCPVGATLSSHRLPNGLRVKKVAVPLGVVAIIYESRPNVTSDAAALCLKSGNVCVLRSGRDAFASANAITDALRAGLVDAGLHPDLIQLVQDPSRQSASELMTAVGYVDLLIPRGGGGLIRACTENAKVPCIQTGMGICHIYVDRSADQDMALTIINNAKTSRPSVCNAEEVLLVQRDIAASFLPRLKKLLVDDRAAAGKPPVELRLDAAAAKIIDGTPAGPADFDTEFLDYILAVRVVDGVREAIAHINAHSTHHSEAIVTASSRNAARFCREVDSAAVYVNASTRFTDGGEFGLGCEMGISTQKLHARGPMGLRELTTYKYVITGEGQIR